MIRAICMTCYGKQIRIKLILWWNRFLFGLMAFSAYSLLSVSTVRGYVDENNPDVQEIMLLSYYYSNYLDLCINASAGVKYRAAYRVFVLDCTISEFSKTKFLGILDNFDKEIESRLSYHEYKQRTLGDPEACIEARSQVWPKFSEELHRTGEGGLAAAAALGLPCPKLQAPR